MVFPKYATLTNVTIVVGAKSVVFISAFILVACSRGPEIVDARGRQLPAVGDKAYCFDASGSDILVLRDQFAFEDYLAQYKKFGIAGPSKQQLHEIDGKFESEGKLFKIPQNTTVKVIAYYDVYKAALTRLEAVAGEKNYAFVAQVEILEGPSSRKTAFVAADSLRMDRH